MWSSENAIPAPIANVPQHQHTKWGGASRLDAITMCRRRSWPRRHVIVWNVKLELQMVWLARSHLDRSVTGEGSVSP